MPQGLLSMNGSVRLGSARSGFSQRAVTIPIRIPRLEHQDRPNLRLKVLLPCDMLAPHVPDGRRVEVADLSETALGKLRIRPRPEWPTKPIPDRNSEPHLWALEELGRNVSS